MATLKCPTGWLVVPSTEADQYVPFFVQVREDDIHWKENTELNEILTQFISSGIDEYSAVKPGIAYRIEKDGWRCEIQNDGLVTITQAIYITDQFSLTDDNHMCLQSPIIQLPLFFQEDEFFNIQVTLNSENGSDLNTATINTTNTLSTWTKRLSSSYYAYTINGYDNIQISLYSPIYRFNTDFINEYAKDKLFVMVRGRVPMFSL